MTLIFIGNSSEESIVGVVVVEFFSLNVGVFEFYFCDERGRDGF